MPSSLESCPLELIDELTKLLAFEDIGNLRLACKSLATKCSSSHHVQSFFKLKHVDVTEHALRAFAEGIQAGGLRSLVQELTLSGFASSHNPRKAQRRREKSQFQMQSRISLLGQAFDTLATFCPAGRLASLSLRVVISPDLRGRHQPAAAHWEFEWKPVWSAAVDTFHLVFRALAESHLRVDCLNIFNDPGQQRCSLPCNELSKINWDDQGLVNTLSPLRSLSISISNRVLKVDEDEHRDKDAAAARDERARYRRANPERELALLEDETNFTGFANLVGRLNQLESFHLHYFRLSGEFRGRPLARMSWHHERLLQHVVNLDK